MTKEDVKKILINKFNKDFIQVIDINASGNHFNLLIISDIFVNMALLNRHKLIYKLFTKELGHEIHALQIKTYTNKEWNKESWYNNMNCIKNIGIGSKITQWKKITPNISKLYDYLWFLDGDMSLEKFNWKSYYNMLVEINPILSQPGILPASEDGKASDWEHTCSTDKNRNTIFTRFPLSSH